ncbi:MAG: lysophospholipid acyltransferase family protein [Fuerstiella sp.]
MSRIPKILFFAVCVRPLVLIALGLNIVNRKGLPTSGPAVIAANHNSHLDAIVLISLFPLSMIHRVRPAAAADYFLANPWRAWFSKNIMGIIPLDRTGGTDLDVLFESCREALDRGEVLILFPEGSRGDPEKMGRVRKGIVHLLKDREHIDVIPIVMHGLGRALPRGEALFVPFNCDVVIGDALRVSGTAAEFTQKLKLSFHKLLNCCLTRNPEDSEK